MARKAQIVETKMDGIWDVVAEIDGDRFEVGYVAERGEGYRVDISGRKFRALDKAEVAACIEMALREQFPAAAA